MSRPLTLREVSFAFLEEMVRRTGEGFSSRNSPKFSLLLSANGDKTNLHQFCDICLIASPMSQCSGTCTASSRASRCWMLPSYLARRHMAKLTMISRPQRTYIHIIGLRIHCLILYVVYSTYEKQRRD